MNDKTTSPVSASMSDADAGDLAASSHNPPMRLLPSNLRGQWADFFQFLRKPFLPEEKVVGFGRQAIATVRMLVLDLLAMGVLLAIAGIVMAVGVDLPQTALAEIEISAAIVFAVVVAAPVLEEMTFRSWLSGKPRYLIGFPIGLIAIVAAAMLGMNTTIEEGRAVLGTVMLGGIVVYLFAAGLLWKRHAPAWFRSLFVVMFWLGTLAFAAIHLLNFSESNLFALLPLVLPQFVLGTMLGYLRVNYGLWTAIALHMMHNGLIISLVLGATSAAS